jgi:hypothetical protein
VHTVERCLAAQLATAKAEVERMRAIDAEQESVLSGVGPITCRNGSVHEVEPDCLYCRAEKAEAACAEILRIAQIAQDVLQDEHRTIGDEVAAVNGLESVLSAPNPGQAILDELTRLRKQDEWLKAFSDQKPAEAINKMATEVIELRAIVEKLPKTADGVVIGPGTSTWGPDLSGKIIEWKWGVLPWYDTARLQELLSDTYSTREAALGKQVKK